MGLYVCTYLLFCDFINVYIDFTRIMKPKISIIIPVYNAEKYLHKCVLSIINQSFKDFELILVDDGSADSSGILCDQLSLQDSRIKVYHKVNGGATSARKYGVEHAVGDYVMFSDADDEMPSNSLAHLVSYINEETELIAGTIYYQTLDIKIKTATNKSSLSPNEYICHLLNGTTYFGPCSKLIKRNLFLGIDWLSDKEVFQNEDLLMLIQLAKCAKKNIVICNDFIHYNCISREGSTSSLHMSFQGWEKLFLAIERTISDEQEIDKEVLNSYINYIIRILKSGCINNRIFIRHDETLTRLLAYAEKCSIYPENLSNYKCIKSPIRCFLAVLLRRIKDFFVLS